MMTAAFHRPLAFSVSEDLILRTLFAMRTVQNGSDVYSLHSQTSYCHPQLLLVFRQHRSRF